ncbi:hypothetical protein AK812_SmicGene31833 [Symbiodinium microadriaticum]|uniref:Uncharacterized protein n=1 Tax=Symbiodinium microadriaticum TaxID=2951 RepID=A0A1Q9CVR4_SYMMI|nr:hypothetical protein AK812_SmicGene31833 [Symbiodinium microadriaticum]
MANGQALFYVDIALDVKQLGLFWQNKLFGYFFLNVAGMALPPVFTTLEAVDFLDWRSPEEDRLKKVLPPKMVVPAMLLSICTQTHMLLLVAASALSRAILCLQEPSMQRQVLCSPVDTESLRLNVRSSAQVAESAVSALVQMNFLVSALGRIAQIEALELSDEELNSMKLSVLVSCFSLGLGFASRDKADSAVLGLPGKVGWGPTMAGLVLARSLEVFSRILAVNVLQASLRGLPLLRFAGVGAVALAFLAACLAFPDASWADAALRCCDSPASELLHSLSSRLAWPSRTPPGPTPQPLGSARQLQAQLQARCKLNSTNHVLGASLAPSEAAVIAHPGQILEPNSLLKLRLLGGQLRVEFELGEGGMQRDAEALYSLIIHVVLVSAAGGGQLLLRTSTVLPDTLLIAWLVPVLTCPSQSQVVSFLSWAALGLLSWLGHHVNHPRFAALASGGEEPVIAYSTLLAGFPTPDGQVPKAVLAAMQGKVAVDLTSDAAARGLTQQGLERILESTGDVRFDVDVLERLAIPREAVVEGLATSHPTTLHLPDFQNVPADSWERLGASLDSDRLRKVDLTLCFEFCGAGCKALLAGLARCRKLQDLAMDKSWQVPGEAWAELGAAEWPELRKASFYLRLGRESWRFEGWRGERGGDKDEDTTLGTRDYETS